MKTLLLNCEQSNIGDNLRLSTFHRTLSLALLLTTGLVAGNGYCSDNGAAPEPEPETTQKKPWYDRGREFVVHKADNIAQWTDNFFGDSTVEEEAAYSTLRLRLEQLWNETDNFETKVKLRGKLHLPKINKRLSLLFSDDDTEASNDDLVVDDQESPDDIALQYKAREKKYYRIDFKAGLRSSGDPKASVRYRYKRPIKPKLIGRFSEEILYRGGEGFGARTRLNLDKILTDDKVLQWHSRLDWQEEESGIGWSTGFSLDKRLSEKKAISYYTSAVGHTQPDGLVNSYGLGIRYRQNILRPWIFVEIQPSYRWYKHHQDDNRDGVAGIIFRLEAVLEKDFGK